MIDPYFAVIEIQINEGTPAAIPVVFTDNLSDATGEMYAKLGYAYQNPRDYTAVSIIDNNGHNITQNMDIQRVFDNRAKKTPVYSLVEIQINDGVRSAVPVNVQVGADAQSIIMQAYHHAMEYAWNVKRNYTEAVVIDTRGINAMSECAEFEIEDGE